LNIDELVWFLLWFRTVAGDLVLMEEKRNIYRILVRNLKENNGFRNSFDYL